MSGNDDIARCTDSLDARGELSHDVLMPNNLYCLPENGERCALRVVMKLGFEDVLDVVGIGGDAFIEDVEVDASGATRVTVTLWLDLGDEEEEGEDGKENYESEEGEYKC
ncbi:hypothetical protein AHAS_Ahas20G0256200 [Arachis hypogaea]